MRRFVPWGGKGAFVPSYFQTAPPEDAADSDEEPVADAVADEAKEELPDGIEPLFLWQPGLFPSRLGPCASVSL